MPVSHVKSNVVADMAGTVTIFNSQGSTATIAATDLVRPSDWNSAHNIAVKMSTDYGGATYGTSSMGGSDLVFGFENGIYGSASTDANAATMWIGQQYGSYFANIRDPIQGTTTMQLNQSTSILQPFVVQEPIQADFVRIFESGSNSAASTTWGTTANTTYSAGQTRSHNFVIYSRGVGANSMSLQYVTSTQIVEQHSIKWSHDANATRGSQWSVSWRLSLPGSAGVIGYTKDYSGTQTNASLTTSGITGMTGFKQVDYYFPMTLSAGQYWMAYGGSTAQASNGTSSPLRGMITRNQIGVSQGNNTFGTWDATTHSSVNWQPGLGSFSTAGGGTTSSIPISAGSNSASVNELYFQLMRIT